MSRRGFLGTAAAAGTAAFADMTGLDLLGNAAVAGEMKKQQKRVILLWLAGGASQLETWDPKPGAATGGPFRALQTAVPGVHISELMPKMRGRRNEANVKYPDLGAVIAKEMGRADSQVPDYVTFYTQTEGRSMAPGDAGFLGSRYGPMELTTNNQPDNIKRL